jgi:hypothetical protein
MKKALLGSVATMQHAIQIAKKRAEYASARGPRFSLHVLPLLDSLE